MADRYISGKQRSVDTSRFAMVPRNDIPRSAFDIQHGHKTTLNAGYLVPVYVDEVLPGDSFRLRMTAFCRLATPIVPIMDNLIMESFFFYVPYRLVWTTFERFMGEQTSPSDTTDFLIPQVPITQADCVVAGLADVMGITLNNSANTVNVSALPFRAYNLIWNEWFRDEDIQTPATVNVTDGPDAFSAYGLLYRGKRHDYFTSARPWPQKPLEGSSAFNSGTGSIFGPLTRGQNMSFPSAGAPVSGIGVLTTATSTGGPASVNETGSRVQSYANYYRSSVGAQEHIMEVMPSGGNFPNVRVLINDIRTANAVQVMIERNARGGTRYAEIVRSHFGVISPDARLQRPEYLGGGRANITINPVAQTSETSAGGVLGELAGVGTAVAQNHGFSHSFTEHGVILGLVSVRADLSYQQGINRMWSRRTVYDFYWPGLAHLGEQPIMTRELYADGSATDQDVFGYQERWAEYKYKPSRISGAFRSTVAQPLDIWHLSQEFSAAPLLNNAFIIENPPVSRVTQTDTIAGQQFLFDSIFDCRAVRAMPMFSIPGLGPRL